MSAGSETTIEHKSPSDKENAEGGQTSSQMDTANDTSSTSSDSANAKRKNTAMEVNAKQNGSKKPVLGGQKTSKQLGQTEWWEITDPNCEKPYFYSTKSHKTQWQNPLGNTEPKKKKLKINSDGPPRTNQVRTNQPRGDQASRGDKPKEKTSKQIGDSDWWIIHDPAAERPYYYNAKSNKTQWVHPLPEKKEKKTGLSDALSALAKQKRDPVANASDKNLRNVRLRTTKVAQPNQAGKTNKRIGNSDWYVINDAKAGCVYYYNAKTEKTQWNVPAVAAMPDSAIGAGAQRNPQQPNARNRPMQKRSKQIGNSEWWKIDDPAAERPYYYNTQTQKTQWSPPPVALNEEHALNPLGKKTSKQLGDSEWWMINDPNAAKAYYYNAVTQMTQWQDPRKKGTGRPQVPKTNKPKTKPKSPETEPIDVSDGLSLLNGISKCSPKCEAKAKVKSLITELRSVKQQKQMWCQKYTEAQDQLSLSERNAEKAQESRASSSSTTPPSIDNLANPIPRDTAIVKKELFKNVEEVTRERLLSALSTSDLRQALSLKAELASPYAAQILYKYMFQAPIPKQTGDEQGHPTHSSIGSRSRKRRPLGDTDPDLPFPCFKCGLRFDTQQEILTHMRTHTYARAYACTEKPCREAFSDKATLDLHRAAKHKPSLESGASSLKPPLDTEPSVAEQCVPAGIDSDGKLAGDGGKIDDERADSGKSSDLNDEKDDGDNESEMKDVDIADLGSSEPKSTDPPLSGSDHDRAESGGSEQGEGDKGSSAEAEQGEDDDEDNLMEIVEHEDDESKDGQGNEKNDVVSEDAGGPNGVEM